MNDRVVDSQDVWLDEHACRIDSFRAAVERRTELASVPLALDVVANVPVYDSATLRGCTDDPARQRRYMAEWHRVLSQGPGILVFRQAVEDTALIDAVTRVLNQIIETESRLGTGAGDHFAAAGANSRVWNAHEKLCMAAPELFARYNATCIVPLVSQAWLGPLYQITTQVNLVRPGGQAQSCHRDYHMGFQPPEQLAAYPATIHALSPMLTLQGAIAHCDMPVESGPTKLLPYSQTWLPGYLATGLPAFRDYFESNYIQLALDKGDALFFNPAVFHAAGENRTTHVDRMANLLQIGSGYARSIEIVDRMRMCIALYPTLLKMTGNAQLDERELEHVIAACAEGYPFPANLDLDSPLTGMAPQSQQQLMHQALAERWAPERFTRAVQAQQARKRSH